MRLFCLFYDFWSNWSWTHFQMKKLVFILSYNIVELNKFENWRFDFTRTNIWNEMHFDDRKSFSCRRRFVLSTNFRHSNKRRTSLVATGNDETAKIVIRRLIGHGNDPHDLRFEIVDKNVFDVRRRLGFVARLKLVDQVWQESAVLSRRWLAYFVRTEK